MNRYQKLKKFYQTTPWDVLNQFYDRWQESTEWKDYMCEKLHLEDDAEEEDE